MKKNNATRKQTLRQSDLTDRREVEERLCRSEERCRRIFENIQDIYDEVGLDGTILEILREASERRVDLIVIASHGKTGLKKYVIGSVAEKVMRGAKCPVLLIRNGKRRHD